MGKPAEEPVPIEIEQSEWKKPVDIPLLSERAPEPVQLQVPAQIAPVDLPDALNLADIAPRPANDPSALLQMLILKGKEDDVEKFKSICATHFPEGSPMSVTTTCGLPLGTVQGLINEAQKINPHIDLSKDHIITTVRIKKNCRKCNGNGYMGRLANTDWTSTNGKPKFHSFKMKCTCLKLELALDKAKTPTPETEQQKESPDVSKGEKQDVPS